MEKIGFHIRFLVWFGSLSTGHVRMDSSVHLNTLFSDQAVNQYFVHILLLVTDNPS